MMPKWKQCLLQAYLAGSFPYRTWNNARLARRNRSPLMILFYHRVADTHPNGWTISTRQFAREIGYLQRQFEMISMAEIQRRLRTGQSPRPAVHITFDDGYAETCDFAIPLLVRERIPTTYFVTLGNVVEGKPFPHDLERGAPLAPNSVEQLREMAEAGIEIGAHTRTHPVLSRITDPAELQDEVVTAGRELGELIGRPMRYFACPFGLRQHFHDELFSLARAAGYEAVVSAYGGYNFPGNDDFHLQRIHGSPLLVELMNWLTLDPVKVLRTQPIAKEFAARSADSRRRPAYPPLMNVSP
jgi:peptidoglycan/xylan/chitin deacetylase (PgdA/CDA1 family)